MTRWYDGLSRDRYTLPADVQAKVRELAATAKTRLDTIRAVHRWVAQDIRYISIALGVFAALINLPVNEKPLVERKPVPSPA